MYELELLGKRHYEAMRIAAALAGRELDPLPETSPEAIRQTHVAFWKRLAEASKKTELVRAGRG